MVDAKSDRWGKKELSGRAVGDLGVEGRLKAGYAEGGEGVG